MIGTPPIIIYVVSLAYAPSRISVQAGVTALLEQYPILRCCIPNPHTPHPRYGHNTSIQGSDVLHTLISDQAHASLFEQELEAATQFDIRAGPLWRVTLVQGTRESSEARLALSINHMLTDGLGGLNLLSELLHYIQKGTGVAASVSNDNGKVAPPCFPSTLEDSIDIRPGIMTLFYVILAELVAPRLPWFLRPRPPMPHWPNPLAVAPISCHPRATLLQLPCDIVKALKSAAQARSVRTLHPLLHTIALCALYHTTNSVKPLHVKTGTPMSERSSAAGHPSCTGNYLVSHSQMWTLTPTSSFWDLARSYADELVDPTTRARARAEMGMLAYVPNPTKMPAPDKSGWEAYFGEKLASSEAFSASMELSNLGAIKGDWEGVKEVVYGQMPGALGSALTLSVRLRITYTLIYGAEFLVFTVDRVSQRPAIHHYRMEGRCSASANR